MGKIIAEVQFSPIGTATPSVSKYVTAALAVLQTHTDVKYELNSMGTVLEGERHAVMDVIEEMNEAIFAAGALRVGTLVKIDDRRDKDTSMEHKVQAVREGLEGTK